MGQKGERYMEKQRRAGSKARRKRKGKGRKARKKRMVARNKKVKITGRRGEGQERTIGRKGRQA